MSQTLLNIPSTNKDPFYRYKMPKLLTKVEGKGNGIKTVIPNMPEIAKALNRPPAYATKFFGFEVGSLTVIDEEHSKYIVNGVHDSDKLQKLLDIFINKFVLCGGCGNPETNIVFEGDRVLKDCKACGKITEVDRVHRLTAFIIKTNVGTGAKGKGKGKKGKENEAEDASADANGSTLPLSGSMEKLKVEEQQQEQQQQQQQQEINDENAYPEEYEDFIELLRSKKDSATDQEIFNRASSLSIPNHKAVAIVIEYALSVDEPDSEDSGEDLKTFLGALGKRTNLLKKFVTGPKDQKGVIGGVERLVGLRSPSLLSHVWKIFKSLYDLDLLEEDVLLDWSRKITRKYVDKETCKLIHIKAKPFIKWLEEADEESEDESD